MRAYALAALFALLALWVAGVGYAALPPPTEPVGKGNRVYDSMPTSTVEVPYRVEYLLALSVRPRPVPEFILRRMPLLTHPTP